MRIALICGSPKAAMKSSSEALLEVFAYYVGESAELIECKIHANANFEEEFEKMKEADTWVFAYPLYVDGIPGHLLKFLVWMEENHMVTNKVLVYAIVNSGFCEGIQNEFALKILENWCTKAGCIYGGGIGAGGGGGLANMPAANPGEGPRVHIDRAISELVQKVLQSNSLDNRFVTVAFPKILYKMGAQMGWRQMIRANGGKNKDLGNRPEM